MSVRPTSSTPALLTMPFTPLTLLEAPTSASAESSARLSINRAYSVVDQKTPADTKADRAAGVHVEVEAVLGDGEKGQESTLGETKMGDFVDGWLRLL